MPRTEMLVERIIKEQELIIGPLAWREAKHVKGLRIEGQKISFVGSPKQALNDLVTQYKGLFGPASVEVCRDAVRGLIPDLPVADVPDVLK